jgi:ATP-binding cassette subfamily C protein
MFAKKWRENDSKIPHERMYGFLQNLIYSVKKLKQYQPVLLWMTAVSSISLAIYTLVGIYLPKMVIDLLEKQVLVQRLIIVIIVLGFLLIITNLLNIWSKRQFEWRFSNFVIHLNKERMIKMIQTDYENLENPIFLDVAKRAERATYREMGFYELYTKAYDFLVEFVLVVFTAVAIIFLNPLIIPALGIMSYGTYKILDYTMGEDKVKHNDVLASTFRKIRYLDHVARDYDYAKDIRFFSMSNWMEGILKKLNKEYILNFKQHHDRWIACDVKMNIIVFFQSIILYVWLVYMVIQKNMSISNFVLYVGMVNAFSKSLTSLFWSISFLSKDCMEINDYRTFMEWPQNKVDVQKGEGTITNVNLDFYEFCFEHVSFCYPGNEEYVLKDINLTLTSGMKMAIVGINGVGKTTFTKLLMKLYEPTNGRILLNGIDLKKYDRESYCKIFSPVFQNVEYFAAPLWSNVSFQKEKITNRKLVEDSLRRSGLGDKTNQLKFGIDTQMLKIFTEEGVDFSGGEKQRLAMARALYKNASVIILDEPTAALDALAEDRMYQEFDQLVQHKTTIFISHRLSSTRFCDVIALFQNGKVIEYGTHEELMKLSGEYAHMYQVQAQYYQKEGDTYETA